MIISITGSKGFLGSLIKEQLIKQGHEVYPYLRKDAQRVYLFGSPSSQIIFSHAPEYCNLETIQGFINARKFCYENGIKLIYPSSATTYSLSNNYAKTKAQIEELAKDYDNTLGFRIFAGYGYEESKGEYASVIYQFCKQMKNGEKPVIWGDGTQSRDFVFGSDIVNYIIENSDKTGVYDLGTGVNTSFNEIIEIINEELGTNIKPVYVDKPSNYIQETPCKNPVNFKYNVRKGVEEILKRL